MSTENKTQEDVLTEVVVKKAGKTKKEKFNASFKHRLIPSSGLFYYMEGDRKRKLLVKNEGIRGITATATAEKNLSNIQNQDYAKTSSEASKVGVEFTLRVLPLTDALHGYSTDKMKKSVDEFLNKVMTQKESGPLDEVCGRYARNILNARWLFRNRNLVENLKITITNQERKIEQEFGAGIIGFKNGDDFDNLSENEEVLKSWIKQQLLNSDSYNVPLHVDVQFTFGYVGEVQVYPSEEYVRNKEPGIGRVLQVVNISDKTDNSVKGQAILSARKISNAIRTIDTWWDKDASGYAIPVEPYGGFQENNKVHRKEDSIFRYLRENAEKKFNINHKDACYVLASIIRGGLYYEENK